MSIQNLGGIEQVLQNHDAKSWVRKTDLGAKPSIDNLDFTNNRPEMNRSQSFSEMLAGSIMEVNGLQNEANVAIENLVSGRSQNLHETMLAVEKAEIAFRTMNQVRQKVLDAYQEVMRMQV